ncbi:MAG: GNAT family N-acetyltransferase [Lutibacter sp.]|nr:MAG: GNAT family N-acetyltransferase [Lutibacter sp.]
MTTIVIANKNSDFKLITELASIIWKEHYTPIIGIEQVEYMLEKFQSVSAIKKQIEEGAKYFMISHEDSAVGYLSVSKKENSLFLSKIYILSSSRGKRIGKTAMQFIENLAKEKQCNSISLTVNKYNTNSIKAYEKMGFKNIEELIMDIGNGYVMDDYKMKKKI